MKTQKIMRLKKELVSQATIYNISLLGDEVFIANGIFTHNTKPHIIRPVNAKSLHWKSGGEDVFASVVYHPGTTPNPFIRRTINTKLRDIVYNNFKRQFEAISA